MEGRARPRDPGAPRRRAPGYRQPHRLSVQRGSLLHLGPSDLRCRRAARVTTARGTGREMTEPAPAIPSYDLLTLGETLLRLSPPGMQRLDQAKNFEVAVGGSELNVASMLARLGRRTAWVSRLPEGPLGRIVEGEARRHGVDTRFVRWIPEARLGLMFFEPGPAPRNARVIYDRKHSAASEMGFEDAPWEALIAASARLHLSGITPALGPSCRALVAHVAGLAAAAGKPVSYDLNYRATLWSADDARAMLDAVAPYLELFVVAERDARAVLGFEEEAEALAEA